MGIQLRNYQDEAIAMLRQRLREGAKRLVLCAPTGAGKTELMMFMFDAFLDKRDNLMAQGADVRGKRALFI